jgi:acetyl esterase/lipase
MMKPAMALAVIGMSAALAVAATPGTPGSNGAGAATTATAPATTVPAGWVAALNKEVPLTGGGASKPLCFNLWEGSAPGQVMNAAPETDDGTGRIRNVSIPGVLVYLPPMEKLTASGGACVISCMGGAYDHLTRLVGADNTVSVILPKGIAVVSLKYRLKPASRDPEADAVADGKRAIRFVRVHAAEWGIDPQHVGLMGWSAGGNLILSLATHLEKDGAGDQEAKDPVERESCRPDFVTLLSPWPNAKQIAAYPPNKAEPGKSKGMPPAFIGSARDDTTAPFTFAKAIQSGWEDAGGKVEFYEIATGGHGAFELLAGTAKDWMDRWLPWMEKNGMWKKL